MMLTTCDTVCPKCRHVFPIPALATPTTCPLQTVSRSTMSQASVVPVLLQAAAPPPPRSPITQQPPSTPSAPIASAFALSSPPFLPRGRTLHQLSGGGLISTSGDDDFSSASSDQLSPNFPLVSTNLPNVPLLLFPLPMSQPSFINYNHQSDQLAVHKERLQKTLVALKRSGWYYENLSWQESQSVLKGTEAGTFLIRDSSNSNFVFALSVQTMKGPTSVRIRYTDGYFILDCEPKFSTIMPRFECVLQLLEYYIKKSDNKFGAGDKRTNGSQGDNLRVWIDPKGQMYSPIDLKRPLIKKDCVPSLQHAARLAINKSLESNISEKVEQLDVPRTLKTYIMEYPYSI